MFNHGDEFMGFGGAPFRGYQTHRAAYRPGSAAEALHRSQGYPQAPRTARPSREEQHRRLREEAQERDQQRQELLQKQQRQREEARREEEARLRTEQLAREKRHRARVLDSAAAQLKAYGFTDNEAIAEVLAKHGPGDLKSCVRSLVELNRTRAAARKAAFSSETESASTSPAASSSSEPDEEPMSQAEAASVVQGLVRGRSTR